MADGQDTQWGVKQNGKGKYGIGENFRYEGGFDEGFQYTGQGTAEFKDKGEKQTGIFKNSILVKGIVQKEEQYYDGELKNDIPDGKGYIKYKEGDTYEGDFQRGIKSGFGKYYIQELGSTYEGNFEYDRSNGEGKLIVHKTGEIVEGHFVDGVCRKGVHRQPVTPSQVILDDLKNLDSFASVFSTLGKAARALGSQVVNSPYIRVYEGEFDENAIYHGKGKLTDQNGDYEGEFWRGMKHGQGEFKGTDGAEYLGEFRDDNFEGQGKLTQANGDWYMGWWKDGRQEGLGVENRGGRKLSGTWQEGVLKQQQEVTMTDNSDDQRREETKGGNSSQTPVKDDRSSSNIKKCSADWLNNTEVRLKVMRRQGGVLSLDRYLSIIKPNHLFPFKSRLSKPLILLGLAAFTYSKSKL